MILHTVRIMCQFLARHQSLVWAGCARMKFVPTLGVRLEAHACDASYGVSVVPEPATRVREMFYPPPWGRSALYSQTKYHCGGASAGLHIRSRAGVEKQVAAEVPGASCCRGLSACIFPGMCGYPLTKFKVDENRRWLVKEMRGLRIQVLIC